MDLSEGMIAIAREADPMGHYEVADMVAYCPQQTFDLVTCTGDAINHVASLSDVAKIFANVFCYTKPGGYFVFDLLKENEVSDSEPFEMEHSADTRVWFQMTRPTQTQVNLKIRVFERGIPAFEENIRETLHDPTAVCELLRRVGFSQVTCADRLLEDGNSGTTWFVVARKSEEGLL
jgi:SAM-dependent methyltransferase